jgi:hypothetical protein
MAGICLDISVLAEKTYLRDGSHASYHFDAVASDDDVPKLNQMIEIPQHIKALGTVSILKGGAELNFV